ncbi:hypothetical protein QVD17_26907 [Tagetes erecta]|uniref:Bulb-type lectin domain-containing protein n=1 Tax=Tagetes erecta TaxID=13708 RepID=A0AAD8K9X0_TARER|nr:hypothetical protein QVD17_26907 [Tagetes erecta]
MITLIMFIVLSSNPIINHLLAPAYAVSTIKVGDQLNITSKLVSPATNFTLGFFTIPETNNTYLGIWYTIDDYTKVWVANPSTPINTSSSVLMIDPDTAKLIISTERTTLVNISDNESGPSFNLTATLQDTGDFQLKNETDNRIIWRSFDYPTNVLLPGMKLGLDRRTGRSWNLTSWLSDVIPGVGAFTMSWEPTGDDSQRFTIQRRGQPYWRIGDSNNQR